MSDSTALTESLVPDLFYSYLKDNLFNSNYVLLLNNHLVENCPWFIPLDKAELVEAKPNSFDYLSPSLLSSAFKYMSEEFNLSKKLYTKDGIDLIKTVQDHFMVIVNPKNKYIPCSEYKINGILASINKQKITSLFNLQGLFIKEFNFNYDYNNDDICLNIILNVDYYNFSNSINQKLNQDYPQLSINQTKYFDKWANI